MGGIRFFVVADNIKLVEGELNTEKRRKVFMRVFLSYDWIPVCEKRL